MSFSRTHTHSGRGRQEESGQRTGATLLFTLLPSSTLQLLILQASMTLVGAKNIIYLPACLAAAAAGTGAVAVAVALA